TLIEPTNRNKYGFNSIKSANTTIIPSISIHCESSKIILGTCMLLFVIFPVYLLNLTKKAVLAPN
ncbi:MAG: hypothetical protein ACYDCN_16150, partial [Bacteroidia bacterium]